MSSPPSTTDGLIPPPFASPTGPGGGEPLMHPSSGIGGTTGSQQKDAPPYIAASLCRFGQDIVQDIIMKTTELFNILKNTQLPGSAMGVHNQLERQSTKLQELLKEVNISFKKLRLVYNECKECCDIMDTGRTTDLFSLVTDAKDPLKQEAGQQQGDGVPSTLTERQELVESIEERNSVLYELMLQLRNVIWDINSMMAMAALRG